MAFFQCGGSGGSETHVKQPINSETGVHSLRHYDEKLQFQDEEGSWVDITSGDVGFALLATLNAGETELIIEDERITTDSKLYAVYTSVFGASLKSAVFGEGSLTLTFIPQAEDMIVRTLFNSDSTNSAIGADGKDGANGKSAYQYAVDGGYKGTEEEFTAELSYILELQGEVNNLIGSHTEKSISSEEGAHGIRYYNGILEVQDEGHWQTAYRYTEPVKNITIDKFAGNGNLTVTWQAPDEYDCKVASYNIYMCVKEETPTFYDFELVKNTTSLTHTFTGVEDLKNTYLLIASVSSYGDIQKSTDYIKDLSSIPVINYESTLEQNSWETISQLSELGVANQIWSVGDTKTFLYYDISLTAQIYDFNHDDKADGSGKAGITFGLKNAISSTISKGSYDWTTCSARTELQTKRFDNIEEELKNVIKEVNKYTDGGVNSTGTLTSVDKLFLLSNYEVGLSGRSEGYKYPVFTDNTSRIKHTEGTTTAVQWLLRSNHPSNSSYVYMVSTSGTQDVAGIYSSYYTVFGFCV